MSNTTHNPAHTWGHNLAFSEEYYREAHRLLTETLDDVPRLTEVAVRAVDTIRAGNTVYANVTTGHMPTDELANEREGNPAPFFYQGPDNCTPEQYAGMKEGDLFLTNQVNEDVRAVRDRGVHVVVYTTCYIDSGGAPEGWVTPNADNLLPADVANEVFTTRIPWQQGLVHAPEVPEMEVFPGSSNITCSLHWCLTAEVAHALGSGSDATPDGAKAREYLGVLLQRLEAFHAAHATGIDELAATLAERVISGGHVDLRGANEAVRSEVHGVAQGLMLMCAFEPRPASDGGDKDTMIITAVSADDPTDLGTAADARGNGNLVVGIGPGTATALREACDVYMENGCDETAGVVEVAGADAPVCPVSGIVNNVAAQMLVAQMADEMCRRGALPFFYMGLYRSGGREYNSLLRHHFQARGY